jgi:hypothetical protein
MQPGMVIFDIIEDQNNIAPGMTTDSFECLEKQEESFAIEAFSPLAVDELPAPDAHSAKVVDSLSGGMMQRQQDRLLPAVSTSGRQNHVCSKRTSSTAHTSNRS